MTGKACVDFRNGIYHVYNRGVNKQNIFCDDEDRWYFINLCRKTKIKYDVEFLAFCLMGNHYHLFVRTPDANLSTIMKYIDERFSKYYIKKYKSERKSGHTFMGPYGRRIVQCDRYASILLAYIHNNPVKDGFVEHPADYQWSSYSYYENNKNKFDLINKDLLADKFVSMPRDKAWKEMIDPEFLDWEPGDHTLGSLFLSDIEFARNIFENHLKNKVSHAELELFNKLNQPIDSQLMRKLVSSLNMDTMLHHRILIYSLLRWTEVQSSELEVEFGVSAGALRSIKSRVNQKIKAQDEIYMEVINRLQEELDYVKTATGACEVGNVAVAR